eukprot:8152142-Ditylum_brightwellii.AAC.1
MESALFFMEQARLDAEYNNNLSLSSVCSVDQSVADIHKMKIQNVMEIRKTLGEENKLITAFGDMSVCSGATIPNCMLSPEQEAYIFQFVEEQHSKGKACTNLMLQHKLFAKYNVEISPS